jgi:hypothetical protein
MRMDFAASIAHISTDWVILVVLFALGAFDGYQTGGSRAATVAISLVLATSLVALVPHTALLQGLPDIPHREAILVALIFAGLYFLVRRITESFGSGLGGMVSMVLGGIGTTAVILALWIGTPALAAIWGFAPGFQTVFSESYRLFWILGGIVALSLARG